MTRLGPTAIPGFIDSIPTWVLAAVVVVCLSVVVLLVLTRPTASPSGGPNEFEAVFVGREEPETPTPPQRGPSPSSTRETTDLATSPPSPSTPELNDPADTGSALTPPGPSVDPDVTPLLDRTPAPASSDPASANFGESPSTPPPAPPEPEATEPADQVWQGELAGGGTGATWIGSTTARHTTLAGLWMERSIDCGEDAPPTIATGGDRPLGLVAVYDGTGGAGAGLAGVGSDGAAHTGAWLASRAVRAATEAWFADSLTAGDGDGDSDGYGYGYGEFTVNLHDALHTRLTAEMDQVAGSSRIAGTLRRDLPTTLAGGAYRLRSSGAVDIMALWVGDSRVFLLTPGTGLQQLTTDDSSAPDALSSLIDDPPMNNIINATGDFIVNATRRQVAGPVVVVAATDGCFGYVATPAHFELMVLRALDSCDDLGSWMRTLLESIQAITSDDASLAVASIGFNSHDELRSAFTDRLAALESEHWVPYLAIDHNDHAQLAEFRQRSWDSYRADYEALLEAGS